MLARNSFEDSSQIYKEFAPAKKLFKPILGRKSFDNRSLIYSELEPAK